VNKILLFIDFDLINWKSREKTTLDIGTRLILESEQLLNKTLTDQISRANSENQESQAKFLPGR
jgi:hypothetical protein